jgi:DNA polymerase-3 subunit epsilon
MTRGQNSLGMDIEEDASNGGIVLEQVALAEIFVLRASSEERQAHEELLNGLDKAVKGTCIWRTPIS